MPNPSARLRDLTDEELMSRYAAGEEACFEILLARHRRPLFGFLVRFLGRGDRAEDVFQEVFFEIIRAKRRYRKDAKFTAWMYRIARNRAVDRLRRDGFRDMESLDQSVSYGDETGESRANLTPSDAFGPEELTQGHELVQALDRTLKGLPDEQREVFLLKEQAGLSVTEIAAATEVSPNTVKSRLRYALEKIRSELTKQGFKP